MNYILFDGTSRNNLLPFTFTRPVADIRVGILTLREKWELLLQSKTSTLTKTYLQEKFPLVEAPDNVLINASFFPTKELVTAIHALKDRQAIYYRGETVAIHRSDSHEEVHAKHFQKIEFQDELWQLKHTWDIFSFNDKAIKSDFILLTKGRTSAPVPEGVFVKNKQDIFIEDSAEVNFSYLNAEDGPIYIGNNAKILEGAMIRGSFALGENSIVKMGAKIYGATTIGKNSKVGGEINNSVMFANSNKGHDGYLGNAVIGEWCNLGADTNNSNLKNNYVEVRLWDYESETFAKTGLQFCGLMMGDHSKCGINTMFNTGTVVGVSANIFGDGFPRNFIPSFSWGGASGFTTYQLRKAKEVARVVMARRNKDFDITEERILEEVFALTQKYRKGY